MKKTFTFTLYFFICYLIYGLYVSQHDISVIGTNFSSDQENIFNDYKGVINIHSSLSSGTGSVKEIIKAANEENLDFLFFTELNNFSLPNQYNKYQGNVLSFMEGEYSYLNSRIIYLNQNKAEPLGNLGQAYAVLSDHLTNTEKNQAHDRPFTILAHPTKKGFNWEGPPPLGLDGIELINLRSIWQKTWIEKKITFIWSFLMYPFNPDLAFLRIFQRTIKEFKLWDTLNKSRLRVAFAGTDAQSKLNFFNSNLNFPSYNNLFRIVSNHVLIQSELTKNSKKDRKKILKAITGGQFYMSLNLLGSTKGFAFYGKRNRSIIKMGSAQRLKSGTSLLIDLPKGIKTPLDIEIYKDGELWKTTQKVSNSIKITEPGIYRSIVYVKISLPMPEGRKWYPWIISNPIQWN